jgi:hypothetical protein
MALRNGGGEWLRLLGEGRQFLIGLPGAALRSTPGNNMAGFQPFRMEQGFGGGLP